MSGESTIRKARSTTNVLRLHLPSPPLDSEPKSSAASTSALSAARKEKSSDLILKPLIRNTKRLSLSLPPLDTHAASPTVNTFVSTSPTSSVSSNTSQPGSQDGSTRQRPSRPATLAIPSTSINTLLHRKSEDDSPSVPYEDGPVEIIPGIWLGSEDNARDWKGLTERNIKAVLNVAQEVNSPFEPMLSQSLRNYASTPNLKQNLTVPRAQSAFYPENTELGRSGVHYKKLDWSHGETNLVRNGFPEAMEFVDLALERGEGVLIHCQCGISRSATLVIALVMRAADRKSTSVPPEVWTLSSYPAAYAFVKSKSKWIGPNMSLIYQLLEYDRVLKAGLSSPALSDRSSVAAAEDEAWGQRRNDMLDDSDAEALALDQAMVDRRAQRNDIPQPSASWKKTTFGRRSSVASIGSQLTSSSSAFSEFLMEEDEDGLSSGEETGATSQGNSPPVEETNWSNNTIICDIVSPSTARPPPSAPPALKTFAPCALPDDGDDTIVPRARPVSLDVISPSGRTTSFAEANKSRKRTSLRKGPPMPLFLEEPHSAKPVFISPLPTTRLDLSAFDSPQIKDLPTAPPTATPRKDTFRLLDVQSPAFLALSEQIPNSATSTSTWVEHQRSQSEHQ